METGPNSTVFSHRGLKKPRADREMFSPEIQLNIVQALICSLVVISKENRANVEQALLRTLDAASGSDKALIASQHWPGAHGLVYFWDPDCVAYWRH